MSKSEFPSIFPRIETARLILREITHADTHAIFRNFSEPEIAKWFFEEPLTDIDQAKQFIDQFNSEFKQGEGITWAIEMKKNNACVGTCSIAGVSIGGEGEIGFDLAKEYWGKGIMSESLTAILDYGFSVLNLSKIDAHTYSTNIKAKHLLEKLGFQLEKVSEDSDYYSLTMEV
ncbi:MAG: GNAT family N-acetyltransferase [Chloroflexota bacterium]|nr:MAG: GNAT family N-acetyltransferase [Chloroflexota bacterium]